MAPRRRTMLVSGMGQIAKKKKKAPAKAVGMMLRPGDEPLHFRKVMDLAPTHPWHPSNINMNNVFIDSTTDHDLNMMDFNMDFSSANYTVPDDKEEYSSGDEAAEDDVWLKEDDPNEINEFQAAVQRLHIHQMKRKPCLILEVAREQYINRRKHEDRYWSENSPHISERYKLY